MRPHAVAPSRYHQQQHYQGGLYNSNVDYGYGYGYDHEAVAAVADDHDDGVEADMEAEVGFSARLGNAKLLSAVLSKLLPAYSSGGGSGSGSGGYGNTSTSSSISSGAVAVVSVVPQGIVFSTGGGTEAEFDDALQAFGASEEGAVGGGSTSSSSSSSSSSVFGRVTLPRALFEDFVITGPHGGNSTTGTSTRTNICGGVAGGCRFAVPLGTVVECLQLFVHAPSTSSTSSSSSAYMGGGGEGAGSSSTGTSTSSSSNAVILSYSSVDAVLRLTLLDDQAQQTQQQQQLQGNSSGISSTSGSGGSGVSIYTTCDIYTLALPEGGEEQQQDPSSSYSTRRPMYTSTTSNSAISSISGASSTSTSTGTSAAVTYDVIVRSEAFRDALSALWEAARTSGASSISTSSGGVGISGYGADVSGPYYHYSSAADAAVRLRLGVEGGAPYLQLALLGASDSCDVLIPGDCSVFVMFPDLLSSATTASTSRNSISHRSSTSTASSSGGKDRSSGRIVYEAAFSCHALHLALKACDVARETRLRLSGINTTSTSSTSTTSSSINSTSGNSSSTSTATVVGGPALIQHQVPAPSMGAATSSSNSTSNSTSISNNSSCCCFMDFVVMPLQLD